MQKHAFGVELDVIAKLFVCICCGFVWIRMGLLFNLCGFVMDSYADLLRIRMYLWGKIALNVYGFAMDLYWIAMDSYEFVVDLHWICLDLLWTCMGLQWICCGFAMDLYWICMDLYWFVKDLYRFRMGSDELVLNL